LRYSIKSFIKQLNQGGLPGEEFVEKGRDIPEGLKVAQVLEKAGYDAFTADVGSYDAWYWAHPPGYQEPGCYLPFTEQLKQVVNVPVIAAGRLERPEVALNALEDNKADMVALGRGLLVDPSWPKKVMDGKIEKVKPCLGCHNCLGRLAQGKIVSCTLNPACCREAEYTLAPADTKKKVVIVGGGIAGMEAARIAALRGHTVKLFEKTDKLGGHLIEASVPDFKQDERRLLDWYIRELADLKVEINLNSPVSKESLMKINADEIIIATGSNTLIPKIPGISNEKVGTATDYLLGHKKAGEKVVVAGGGLTGCETALWLKQQNKQVTLIEMLPELMGGVDPVPHANKTMLLDMLNFNGVTILTNTRLQKVTNEGVEVIHSNHEGKVILADSIVISVGMQPDQELFREMGTRSNIYLIGDSRDPKNILNAIWDAYEITRTI
jgi:2-enoate reductase